MAFVPWQAMALKLAFLAYLNASKGVRGRDRIFI